MWARCCPAGFTFLLGPELLPSSREALAHSPPTHPKDAQRGWALGCPLSAPSGPGRCERRVCPPTQPSLSGSVPSAYGTLTVRSLLDTREHCLNEFNFPDPYSKVSAALLGWVHACRVMGSRHSDGLFSEWVRQQPQPSAGNRQHSGAALAGSIS